MSNKQREALEAALRDAMKKAFNFGQTYWQQADSHFVSQQNKSDITREAFNKIVNDTVRSVLAKPEQEPATRSDGMPTSASERHLRRLLAQRSGINSIYFDDGEASGQSHGVSIDFMRDSVESIAADLQKIGLAVYQEQLQALSPRPREWQELVDYVLQHEQQNRDTPRIIDIAYTAWHFGRLDKNKEDGGPCDWFNDTRPTVIKAIEKISAALRAKNGG